MASLEENGISTQSDNAFSSKGITKLSKNVNDEAWKLIEQALGQVNVESNRPFGICEYGCSSGVGSSYIFSQIAALLKERKGKEQQVAIYYSDLPCNDFNQLFQNLEDSRQRHKNGNGRGQSLQKVFTAAIARSFHEQCLPDNTVHLGYSALSMHWLSKIPSVIEDTVHSWEFSSPEVQAQFALQAEEDWDNLLCLRARELVDGGHCVILLAGRSEDGEYSGCTQTIKTDFFQNLNKLYRQMSIEGIIQKEEFLKVTKHFYARNAKEISKPFEDPDSIVNKLGLQLESVEIRKIRCAFNQKWKESKAEIDINESARSFINSIRIWNEHTWCSSLSDSRSTDDKQSIVEELYNRYHSQIVQAPEDHGYDCVQSLVHFSKKHKE